MEGGRKEGGTEEGREGGKGEGGREGRERERTGEGDRRKKRGGTRRREEGRDEFSERIETRRLTGLSQLSVLLSLNEHLPFGRDDGGCTQPQLH